MPKPVTKEPFHSPCGKAVHDLKDAAACHASSYRIVFAAVKDGDLPAVQQGTKWTVLCEDLLAWRKRTGSPNNAELGRTS